MRVGEDVGRGVRGRDRDVVRDAALLDLGRVERRGPFGDDAVDHVAVRGAVGELGEARIVEQVGPLHRLAQPREVRVGAGDDAHVLAVARSGSCRAAPSSRAGCPPRLRTMPSRS